MPENKYGWNMESALEILKHPTVDSKTWSEAVEWLLLNGPPEIQQMLKQASGHATMEHFPDLKAKEFTVAGEPCYNVSSIANALNISEEEAIKIMKQKEQEHGKQQLFPDEDTHKIQ